MKGKRLTHLLLGCHLVVASGCASRSILESASSDLPELHPMAVVSESGFNKLHLRLSNLTSESWTVETENDWARGRIQLYSEEKGWHDMLAYDWCGTGIAWMQLLPGGTIDLTVDVNSDIRRLRVGVRMLKRAMWFREESGFLWPPLGSDEFMAYSEPVEF